MHIFNLIDITSPECWSINENYHYVYICIASKDMYSSTFY